MYSNVNLDRLGPDGRPELDAVLDRHGDQPRPW
jgi:hypothetical protein